MTTENIIATLKQGVPVTARLVREVIIKLERLDWAERSLKAALEKYGAETVPFTGDECGYVCEALEESERLKEAVRWWIDCHHAYDVADFRGSYDATREASDTFASAMKEVEELI